MKPRLYDHVSPQPMQARRHRSEGPAARDICATTTGPTCNFTWTGYRYPWYVSPYAKKNYVDHSVADYTAILKFIETRWSLPALSARDAAQSI